jgi:hypothetical protein
MDLEELANAIPVTAPDMVGAFNISAFEKPEALANLLRLYEGAARAMFDERGGVRLTFLVFCSVCPLTQRKPEDFLAVDIVASAKAAARLAGVDPGMGVIYELHIKPEFEYTEHVKHLTGQIIKAVCRTGKALGVLVFSETWVNKNPEYAGQNLEGKPGTTDQVVVCFETATRGFVSMAEITRGEVDTLGEFVGGTVDELSGRFAGNLRKVSDLN